MRPRSLLAAALLAAGLALPARAADDGSLEARLAEKAPAIVTIKVVLRAGQHESTREVHGVVVDPSGLVMASASRLSPGERSPTRLHVIVGNDPKEHPAVLVARDSALRLAYLQVLDAKDLASVDLSKGAAPKVGQDLVGVSRSERGFDFTPKVQRLYVTGRLEKPRPLWDFAGDFMETGLPVFDLAGAPVGVIVEQAAPSGVDSEGEETEIFILPLDAATKSLEAARKRIPDAVARAKEGAEKEAAAAKEEEEAAAKPKEPPATEPAPPKDEVVPDLPKAEPKGVAEPAAPGAGR